MKQKTFGPEQIEQIATWQKLITIVGTGENVLLDSGSIQMCFKLSFLELSNT